MRAVLATPPLRRLTAAAFVLMVLHGCFQTFTVAFLVEGVGLSLTMAGALFAVEILLGDGDEGPRAPFFEAEEDEEGESL